MNSYLLSMLVSRARYIAVVLKLQCMCFVHLKWSILVLANPDIPSASWSWACLTRCDMRKPAATSADTPSLLLLLLLVQVRPVGDAAGSEARFPVIHHGV